MRRPLTALALLASATAVAPTPAAPQTLAITDVNVVDVGVGVVRPGMTVVVSRDRIMALGPSGSVEVPGDARVVDGTARFLIPGLWDMHVHTGSDRNTREIIYPLFVAHGVTGVRNMMGDCFDCGPVDFAIDLVHARRRAVAAGELIGPRVVASSAYAGSHEQAARRSTEGSSPQAPATAADARAFVRLAKERGVDFIKIYDMLPREAYFALAEEAKRLGLPFAGHVPVEVRASEASDAGQASIEHRGPGSVLEECSSREDELRARVIAELHKAEMGARHTPDGPAFLPLMLEMVDTHDPAKCAALAERFVQNGTWRVPTLMTGRLPSELGRGWREDPYARFLPPEERRYFEWAEETYARDLGDAEEQAPVSRWVREVTRAMHRAGVRMLAGSDAGETGIFWGISLHQELELLVSAGLTAADALRAATLGAAEFLEATDSLGTVEVGKLADLVLLDANPLDDISNTQRIAAVVLGGRYLDRAALDELLERAERAADPDRQVVEAVIRGYLDAFAAQDPELIRGLVTDDFVVIENGYPIPLDRATEGMDPGRPLPAQYRLEKLQIEVDGDLAVYRFDLGWFTDGQQVDWGLETGHARRLQGEWKLARNHMTFLPAREDLPVGTLGAYEGDYRGLDFQGGADLIRLYSDDGRLFMTRPSGRPLVGGILRLEMLSDPAGGFFVEVLNGRVEFERDPRGEVSGLTYVPPPGQHPDYRSPLRYERVR
jgi:ketosteroid isomerase-like protein